MDAAQLGEQGQELGLLGLGELAEVVEVFKLGKAEGFFGRSVWGMPGALAAWGKSRQPASSTGKLAPAGSGPAANPLTEKQF